MRSFFMCLSVVALTSIATVGCAADSSDDAGSTEGASAEAVSTGLNAETAAKAKKILSQKLGAYYGADGTFGDVTEKGAPKLEATSDANIVHATGEFDDNQLWGGEWLYNYDVNINLTTGLIKQVKKPVMVKEIN